MNQHQQPLIFFRVDLNMNHHRHHPTFFLGGGMLLGREVQLPHLGGCGWPVARRKCEVGLWCSTGTRSCKCTIATLQAGRLWWWCFFFGVMIGEVVVYFISICVGKALFIFLLFFSYYFLGCFQMFGLDQLAFLLHHPSSSFPSMIHDPRSRSLWIASVLRPCWVKLWGGGWWWSFHVWSTGITPRAANPYEGAY